MENNASKLAELMASLDGKDGADDSRATSPGPGAAGRGSSADTGRRPRCVLARAPGGFEWRGGGSGLPLPGMPG